MTGFGGAIAGIASSISFNKSIKFDQNLAPFGGAVYISKSRLTIYTETIIIYNIAAHSGGGLFLDFSNVVCSEKCSLKLENNTAKVKDGGVYAVTSTFLIDHDKACVHFTNNKAEKGGGSYFEGNSFFVLITEHILINSSTALEFTSNKA